MSKEKESQLYEWDNRSEEKMAGPLLETESEQQFSYSQRIEMLENREYTYNDNGIQKLAKRSTGKTGYMRNVVNAMRTLEGSLVKKIDFSNNHTSDDFINVNFVKRDFDQAISACEMYLCHRNPWTAEGKARKKIVEDFYMQLKLEFIRFSQAVLNYQTGHGKNANSSNQFPTGAQLLGELRIQKFKDTEEDISITTGGGETSQVFIVEKSGEKKYFKENEKIAKDWRSPLQKELDNLVNTDTENMGAEEAKEIRETNDRRGSMLLSLSELLNRQYGKNKEMATHMIGNEISGRRIFNKLMSESKNRKRNMGYIGDAWEKVETTMDEIESYEEQQRVIEGQLINCRREIEKSTASLNSLDRVSNEVWRATIKEKLEANIQANKLTIELNENKYSILNTKVKDLEETLKGTDYQYIVNVLENIRKASRLSFFSISKAMINKNEEMSKRNVATSRMAQLLGINDIVAESQMAELEVEGKKMRGIMMEEAKGETMRRVKQSRGGKKAVYSAAAYRQLLSLRIFDIICAQIDRHLSNYMAETTSDEAGNITVKNIKGIDNDMSFGELTDKNMREPKEIGDIAIALSDIYRDGKWIIPGIDEKLALKIISIDKEILEYGMMDLLSKKELECLWKRFATIKQLISRQYEEEKKTDSKDMNQSGKKLFMKNDDDWGENMKSFAKTYNSNMGYEHFDIGKSLYIDPDFLPV